MAVQLSYGQSLSWPSKLNPKNSIFGKALSKDKSVSGEKAHYCATDVLHRNLYNGDQLYKKKFDDMNVKWQDWAIKHNPFYNRARTSGTTAVYDNVTLPVVFHFMVNGSSPTVQQVASSSAITTSVITTLNSIFAGQAVGTKLAGNNTYIQFCQAKINNFGQTIATTTYSNPLTTSLSNSNQGQINTLSNVVQSTSNYPTDKYINIYVVEDIADPVAGFAFMPSAHGSAFDGIYIEAKWLLPAPAPNDLAYNTTVLTHEMGHYLGMFHTFGICDPLFQACSCDNNNCLFDGDMVCDTPPDFSQSPIATCSTTMNTCSSDALSAIHDNTKPATDVNDLTDNYMDYGSWNCQYKFTDGQIKRMRFMIDKFVGPRNSLLNSNVCNAACVVTCTMSISAPTSTVNGTVLPNTLILSGASVSQTFTGNSCASAYPTQQWKLINLANNTTIYSGTSSAMTFTAAGNYRIILKGIASNTACTQSDTIDIQVLPAPPAASSCHPNIDMSQGWSQNWTRVQYEGGWSRNGSLFAFPATTLTVHSNTVVNNTASTSPFAMVNAASFATDPNFGSLTLPAGVTNAMRVGRIINATETRPAGTACYVTYTFCPTAANSKFKVYYLGMREKNVGLTDIYPWNFVNKQTSGVKTGFGFVCNYQFSGLNGMTSQGVNHNMYNSNDFNFNNVISGGTNFTGAFTEQSIGVLTFEKMTSWQVKELDFSEFVCASPTITITFFAKTNDASTPGYMHSYAYFATGGCMPGTYRDIDFNLKNYDISCLPNLPSSCASVPLPIAYKIGTSQNGGSYFNSGSVFNLSIQASNTPSNTASWVSSGSYNNIYQYLSSVAGNVLYPVLSLCKSPETANPPSASRSFKIKYQTLCQTIEDTVTVFQGFLSKVNPCNGKSGSFIAPATVIGTKTVSPDKYVQYCDQATLNLTAPCWTPSLTAEYKWQHNLWGNWTDFSGVNTPSMTLNVYPSSNFLGTMVRRVAKYSDPYCKQDTWIPSDTFIVTSFKKHNVQGTIPNQDLCGNTVVTFTVQNVWDAISDNYNFDPEMASQAATVNSITFEFFINSSTTPLQAYTGPSALTYTFTGTLKSSNMFNIPFSFMDNSILSVGPNNIYAKYTLNMYGCQTLGSIGGNFYVKPSAVAGTITPVENGCLTPNAITGNNVNIYVPTNKYQFEYSYTPNFATILTFGSASNTPTLSIPSGVITSYPVYIRRKAFGTGLDCSNPAFSNTVTLNTTAAAINVNTTSNVLCAGTCATLTASGVSTYTWSGAGVSATTPTLLVCNSTTSTAIYTVTGTTSKGCVGTSTIAITGKDCGSNAALTPGFVYNKCTCTFSNTTTFITGVTGVVYNWTVFNNSNVLVLQSNNSTLPINFNTLSPGIYKVCLVVTANNGAIITSICKKVNKTCVATAATGKKEKGEDESAIESLTNELDFNAYPNPATDYINLVWNANDAAEITVTNILNQVIHTEIVDKETMSTVINTQYFKNGIYFVKLTSGEQTITKKIVIQK